jgi:hypothetical protein
MADLDKETRDTLNQIGCILYPGTENAFYAEIPPEALDTVISLVNSGKVRYLGRIPVEAKIRPELLSKMKANPDKSFQIIVSLFDNPDSSQMNQLGNIMQFNSKYYSILNDVYGTIPGNRIQDIIDLSFVVWIEEQSHSTVANNDGTSATLMPQDRQDYLVILNTVAENNKNSVLTVSGVEYIEDAVYTGTDNEEYPAIAISATEQAADQIRNLDSIIAVTPIAGISPVPIIVGNTVIISANITNVGGETGIYKAALSIDGQVTESKDVSIAPGQKSTVEFELNNLTTGSHGIAIGESTTSIDVLPKPTSIAFSCYYGDYYGWEICTMATDGTNSKNITNSTAMDLHPTWSPDGKKIAFESTREWHNRSSIYVMDADGNNVKCLTPEPKSCRFPAWSLDGKKIAYCVMKTSGGGPPDAVGGEEEIVPDTIFIMDADGSAKTLLTRGYSPSWFPDSQRLAFIANISDTWEIRSIDIYGSEIKKYGVLHRARANYDLPLPSTEFPMLAMSPDGNSIALEYFDSVAGQKIYILKLDTGELTNLTGGLYGYSYCPA